LLLYLGVMYVRPGDLFPALEGVPILDTIAAFSFVFMVLSLGFRRSIWPRVPQLTFLILFTVAIVLSQLQTLYLAAVMAAFRQFLVNALLFLLIVVSINSQKRFHRFVTALLLLTLFLAIDGLREHYVGVGWGGQVPIRGRIQGIGIFGDPNDLALALVVAIPLLMDRIGESRMVRRQFWVVSLAAVLAAILFTKSRGGMLALGIALLIYFGRKHFIRGLLITVVAATVFVTVNTDRVAETHTEDDSSMGRLEAWSEGLQMFKSNPLLGVGYGAFLDYHELTAHNSFVLSLAELGVAGTWPWLALVYCSIKGLLIKRGTGPVPRGGPRAWSQSLIASLGGYLVAAFFLSRLYNVVPYIVMGMAVAVLPLGAEDSNSVRVRFTPRDAGNVFAIFCGLLGVVYTMIKILAR